MVQMVIWLAIVALAFAGVLFASALDRPDTKSVGAAAKTAVTEQTKKDAA